MSPIASNISLYPEADTGVHFRVATGMVGAWVSLGQPGAGEVSLMFMSDRVLEAFSAKLSEFVKHRQPIKGQIIDPLLVNVSETPEA